MGDLLTKFLLINLQASYSGVFRCRPRHENEKTLRGKAASKSPTIILNEGFI